MKQTIKRYNTARRGRRIVAEDEVIDNVEMKEVGEVEIASEATELLFEAEDVAELVAAVTGEDVEVTADESQVTFTVDGTDYTVEPEGDEEILEASRCKGKRTVKANTRKVPVSKAVKASTRRPVSRTRRPVR